MKPREPRGKIIVPIDELMSYRYVREMRITDTVRHFTRRGRNPWQNEYKILAVKEICTERPNQLMIVWYLKIYDADVDPSDVYGGGHAPAEAVPPERVLQFFPEITREADQRKGKGA